MQDLSWEKTSCILPLNAERYSPLWDLILLFVAKQSSSGHVQALPIVNLWVFNCESHLKSWVLNVFMS